MDIATKIPRKPAYAWDQEYIRGGKESILLLIAVCKHPLPSTEVKLHNLTHKLTTNVWHILCKKMKVNITTW